MAESEVSQLPPNLIPRGQVLAVPMKRSADPERRNIWEKVHLMWSMIAEQFVEQADWFVKCDDDTFLFVENLRKYVQFMNPMIPRYLGHTLLFRWERDNIVFNAGSSVVLSKEAVKRLGPKLRSMPTHRAGSRDTCADRDQAGEDTNLGICLRTLGINPESSLDEQGRERFLLFPEHGYYGIVRDNEKSWYWKLKPQITGQGRNCCVEHLISAHGYKKAKSDSQFDKLYQKFLNTMNETAELPPVPRLFLFDEDLLPFKIDEFRNVIPMPSHHYLELD